ncbi:hypothetical protein ACFQ07_32755 [Actinomadura adrarensis]|uniref:Uncharacterized protein n=1 Tax=Actinomadura adrarensis TaxID=1819600 RepID=A0ABW3CUJ5_9ACTN
MNDDVVALLFDVVGRLEQQIRTGEYPAIVALQGDRTLVFSDYDYLWDDAAAQAFERRAADHGRRIGVVRWVLAVGDQRAGCGGAQSLTASAT